MLNEASYIFLARHQEFGLEFKIVSYENAILGQCIQGQTASPGRESESLTYDITCPDHVAACDDNQTCCEAVNGTYRCCPLPNASCCKDNKFCCPHGSVCTETGITIKDQDK